MNHNKLVLHMSLIDGVGPSTIKVIVANKPSTSDWHSLYTYMPSDFIQLGVSVEAATKIVTGLRDTTMLLIELDLIEKHAIQWVAFGGDEYPESLVHIEAPPPILYWQGYTSLAAYKKSIAIVGSRKADAYGARVIATMVPPLIERNWTIVSGGALGIDSLAHSAVLACKGSTIAVLGSGLLNPYPESNKKLFQAIVDGGGAVMSSFALKVLPQGKNFPARNRIISGLSRGCLVAQAAVKSGALITAHYALDQGREVFAVPGMIDQELSAGCHELIQMGAKLVTSAADVLIEFGEINHQSSQANSKSGQQKNDDANQLGGQAASPVSSLNREASGKKINSISTQETLLSIDGVFASKSAVSPQQASSVGRMNDHVEAATRVDDHALGQDVQATIQATIKSAPAKKKSQSTANNKKVQKSAARYQYDQESIQARIMALCERPCSVDDMLTELNVELSRLQQILFDMQLDGAVKQDFTGRWAI